MSDWRERVAEILQVVARDGLPEPRDLDVALDAIGCEMEATRVSARIAELEAENASLAANQCIHGIHGDEQGNSYCPRIAELEAALRNLDDMIVDLDAGHAELPQVSRFIAAALAGGKDE